MKWSSLQERTSKSTFLRSRVFVNVSLSFREKKWLNFYSNVSFQCILQHNLSRSPKNRCQRCRNVFTRELFVDGCQKEVLDNDGDQVPAGYEDGSPTGTHKVEDNATEGRCNL